MQLASTSERNVMLTEKLYSPKTQYGEMSNRSSPDGFININDAVGEMQESGSSSVVELSDRSRRGVPFSEDALREFNGE